MQRNKLEVDHLDKRPNHPIALQGRPVALIQLLLRTRTLHYSHTAEKAEQVCAGEDGLIGSHSSNDFGILVSQHDFVLQELEPGSCCWTEDSCGTMISSILV